MKQCSTPLERLLLHHKTAENFDILFLNAQKLFPGSCLTTALGFQAEKTAVELLNNSSHLLYACSAKELIGSSSTLRVHSYFYPKLDISKLPSLFAHHSVFTYSEFCSRKLGPLTLKLGIHHSSHPLPSLPTTLETLEIRSASWTLSTHWQHTPYEDPLLFSLPCTDIDILFRTLPLSDTQGKASTVKKQSLFWNFVKLLRRGQWHVQGAWEALIQGVEARYEKGEGTPNLGESDFELELELRVLNLCVVVGKGVDKEGGNGLGFLRSLSWDRKEEQVGQLIGATTSEEKDALPEIPKTKGEESLPPAPANDTSSLPPSSRNSTIIIPKTQSPPLMTPRQIHQHTSRLSTLSPIERSLVQSEQLSSDMSAFKAANPSTSFKAFVEWYSPKDITSDKELSLRMREKDNLWVTLWESAVPLAIEQQTPLFNKELEARGVFEYLKGLQLERLYELLFPIFVDVMIDSIFCRVADKYTLGVAANAINEAMEAFDWGNASQENTKRLWDLLQFHQDRVLKSEELMKVLSHYPLLVQKLVDDSKSPVKKEEYEDVLEVFAPATKAKIRYAHEYTLSGDVVVEPSLRYSFKNKDGKLLQGLKPTQRKAFKRTHISVDDDYVMVVEATSQKEF